jgi:hypothetical protein
MLKRKKAWLVHHFYCLLPLFYYKVSSRKLLLDGKLARPPVCQNCQFFYSRKTANISLSKNNFWNFRDFSWKYKSKCLYTMLYYCTYILYMLYISCTTCTYCKKTVEKAWKIVACVCPFNICISSCLFGNNILQLLYISWKGAVSWDIF